MDSITITAPAKINLMLDVTGRRSDGYHTLLTIMQSISLSDTVFIELNDSGKLFFECRTDGIPNGRENIAYKAAEAFLDYSGVSCGGLYICVHKNIPFQAGLGGGSADCAAVLIGLNKLLGTGYSEEKLCEIGVKLGADVPFCLVGGTKLCQGIGEEISYVPPLESCFIVIAKGTGGISTKEAYQRIDNLEARNALDISMYDGSISSIKKIGRNIFEEVTESDDVFKIKQICTDFGADYTAMSGSGAAVFGLFGMSRPKNAAHDCANRLRAEGFFADVCIPLSYGAKYFDR